jgi:glycosyltransferase involved in cell wall biosynthesis
MRIVIDLQGAQTASRYRGIGRYTLALTRAMIEQRGEHECLVLLNGLFEDSLQSLRSAFADLLPPHHILVWTAPDPVHVSDPDNQGREALAQLLREAMIASLEPDLVLVSSFFEGYVDNAITSIRRLDMRTAVCVVAYDFIPLINPAHYLLPNPGYARYYREKVQALAQADLLLAISGSSRQEAIDHLGIAPARAVNIAAACDSIFKPLVLMPAGHQDLLERWGITKAFILYTGGADERKNLHRLIQAFAQLPRDIRQTHQLVFAGKLSGGQQAELHAVANKQGLADADLRLTGFVTDDELVLAYNLCRLFVFPSWHEGFGLPPLEAMSCGAAVIAANTSSLPEVVGWAEALFDPFDTEAMSRKILQGLTDDNFRSELVARAQDQARQFSWAHSARMALTAMEALMADRLAHPSQAPDDPEGDPYAAWLAASVAVLEQHGLTERDDLAPLAACRAFNESQVAAYWEAVQQMRNASSH